MPQSNQDPSTADRTAELTPGDPGFSRDPALEAGRGLDRPARAELNADDRTDDPNPERHIHFAPQGEDAGDDVEGITAAHRDPTHPRV